MPAGIKRVIGPPVAVQGGAGGGDGLVDVRDRALRDRRPRLTRVRVERVERAPAVGVDELARDVVFEPLRRAPGLLLSLVGLVPDAAVLDGELANSLTSETPWC